MCKIVRFICFEIVYGALSRKVTQKETICKINLVFRVQKIFFVASLAALHEKTEERTALAIRPLLAYEPLHLTPGRASGHADDGVRVRHGYALRLAFRGHTCAESAAES